MLRGVKKDSGSKDYEEECIDITRLTMYASGYRQTQSASSQLTLEEDGNTERKSECAS